MKVDFSSEEFDMAAIVNDPMYPKIKEYVLKHTGLKVSSACIAQIRKQQDFCLSSRKGTDHYGRPPVFRNDLKVKNDSALAVNAGAELLYSFTQPPAGQTSRLLW